MERRVSSRELNIYSWAQSNTLNFDRERYVLVGIQ